MYDPKFSVKQMYDQYGSSRNTTKTAGPKGFTKKTKSVAVDTRPSRSSGFGGMGPDPAERFGGSPTRGLGSKPTFNFGTDSSGSDNNPNKDEYESKGVVAKLYDRAVTTLRNFGADEPEDVIVDGQRVYQGPLFRGYDPTARIENFGADNNPNRDRRVFMPDSTVNIFGVNTDNPRLNMFGVERKSFRNPTTELIPPVLPESPANMDPMTRTLSQAMIPQAPPVMVDYEVGSFRDTENLMTIVEDLNRDGVDITLEELAKANDLPVNPDGSPVDPFVQKGEVIKVPVQGGVTLPREFMDNETKAMLQETTPIKANFVLDTAVSLANQLSELTRKSKEKYSTGGSGLGDRDRSTYKIKKGDTFYSIAKREGVTLDKLIEANPNQNPNKIQAGQVINIPRGANLDELSSGLKQEIIKQNPKTEEDLNVAIFNGVIKDGTFATPKVGDDPITWIAKNTYGLNENDPEFRKAFKAITKVDPYMTPWCAAFAGHVLKNIGVDLPDRAIQNPNLAFNYINLGDEVYDHNPTTNKTYAGKLSDVKTGDVVVFNNANRDNKGNIMFGKGHISFVVDVLDDGTIIATGGNQAGGTQVATTAYTPDVIKEYYKGGYTVRRITTNSLKGTDPSIIAAITKDISIGGAEQ